ncbi:hypothetical protein ANN_19028 [Periplaneta americana]|uniref:Reverse transcriptase domain-containing protein n=1 Tax=Periplaneta americana TaxID=6978 RepID=A0ABQ8SRP8_PERAM|nr:hypothetical protein ANN_19028 [Periplaneta americana]
MSDVWRVSRALSNPSQSIHPLVVGPDVTAFTPEKATALADVLETTFQPVEQNLNLPHIRAVEESVRDLLSREPENGIRPTNTHEVAHFIRRLGPHKASGADGIQKIILQHLPRSAMKRIAEVINNILASGHYPIPWKEAHVVLFPKPGKDKTNPSNYRPISLLSCLSKLAERVIHRRVTEVVLPQIRNEQFGFHPGRSTTLQALRMTEDITWAMSTKRVVAAAYLDIERAFDKVWHEGLLVKLLGMGVPDGMIRLISNYLRGRTFKTRVGTSFSATREIHAGVPQGSIIGPILFNIFINDLPFRCNHGRSSHLYIYADDTALLAMGKTYRLESRRLQSILDQGIIMDSHLTFRDHIQSLLRKANGLIVRHYPILAALTPDNLRVGLTMYKALIRSVITYAAPAWGFAAVSHLRKLQVIQNQEGDREVQKKSSALISDSVAHHKYAVDVCLRKVFSEILVILPNIEVVKIFLDGAASHFKQKYTLSNVTLLARIFEFNIEWNFFQSYHGKGAVDAIGGQVRRMSWMAAKSGKKIQSATEFCNIVSNKNSKLLFRRIRNDAVLERVGGERMVLKLIRKRKRNWVGHWLRRNCLLKSFSTGRNYEGERSSKKKISGDNASEMSPGSSTESYPAFARIGLRENPGKNLNQVTCPDRDSNPGHLVSQPDALTVTPQQISPNTDSSVNVVVDGGWEFWTRQAGVLFVGNEPERELHSSQASLLTLRPFSLPCGKGAVVAPAISHLISIILLLVAAVPWRSQPSIWKGLGAIPETERSQEKDKLTGQPPFTEQKLLQSIASIQKAGSQ